MMLFITGFTAGVIFCILIVASLGVWLSRRNLTIIVTAKGDDEP